MEKIVVSLAEFEKEAERFAKTLAPKDFGATLVTLSGELGAGKTAFTKAVAKTFGVAEVVTSPTFVLEKIYTLSPKAPFKRFVHIDTYRLESGAELGPLGFDERMREATNLIFLEWPEKVSDALPLPTAAISIRTTAEGARTIFYG